MRAGNIQQFKRFSQFNSINEFNEHKKRFLENHPSLLTKSEFMAFDLLSQYSVVVPGVANAKIDTLVKKSTEKKRSLSRATFIRMLRKAKKAGILDVHKTYRANGGFAHNVFVFQRFDPPSVTEMIQREETEILGESKEEHVNSGTESINLLKNLQDQKINIRKEDAPNNNTSSSSPDLQDLDETFVPENVPQDFIQTVKPFYNRALEIYNFWGKALLAYKKFNFGRPLEFMVPLVIDAFKTTVFQYKHRRIKTSFTQYFYGTLNGMFSAEKRREHAMQRPRYNWLDA
ncbi:hypothetical protein [Bacillus sp. NEB1478]|uniref:hypothetical protein n=1 Tax=Bacillus sp. NEB1478 TaxID=3073816 RepID=UPI002872F965|nr:hypothetical protein [Bacillus sp. NEB1478]WNB91091.1 hypothetical protein RGB74_14410 [Bacillus sp. NEB1478]